MATICQNTNNPDQQIVPIGAAWLKTQVSPETDCHRVIIANRELPELAIGIRSEYRNQGVGKQLLNRLWEDVTGQYRKIPGICLRVRDTNPANDCMSDLVLPITYWKRIVSEVDHTRWFDSWIQTS
jgi:GNAT superfamily N-acetyltransferase